MATITTVYEGNLRTRATHNQSGNTLITDAPTDNHGKGEAFSPTDLFATSLGSCMLTIIGLAANTHGFSIDGTRVETQKVMGSDPRRVAELVVDLYFPANNYSDREKRMIEAAAASCPVAQSLHPETRKTVTFHY